MRRILDRILAGFSPIALAALVILLTLLTAAVDFVVGSQISLAIFYLVPIAMTAWYGSFRAGVILSLVCSGLATWIALQGSETNTVILWNGVAHLGFYYVFTTLLVGLRQVLEQEKAIGRTDHLTGVMNRRALFEQLEFIVNLARRNRTPLTLAYIDLDNFKTMNDQNGHEVGDRALCLVAETMFKHRRRTDLVGRLGGDEFAVVLPDTGTRAARMLLIDFNERIRTTQPHPCELTCSVGVVTFLVLPDTVAEALRLADDCMYDIKQRGGNGVSFVVYSGASTSNS